MLGVVVALWKPSYSGERPTLGWSVLDWITEMLAAPDREEYEPLVPTREQAEFVLRFYEVDRVTGKRVVHRGVLSRPRGWGKSPFVSALAIAEGLADVVGDGFDADGQPVGRPWSTSCTPLVQVAAVSEEQTKNSWDPLLEMLGDKAPVLDAYPGLEPLGSFVNLPRGHIRPITSSSSTVKGARVIFSIMDQTEVWTRSNGGVHMADTMRDNAAKRGGAVLETPNAYTPGDESVAERSAMAYQAMVEGRARMQTGLLWDHREAPAGTELTDGESLVAGLRVAYGDSSDHPDGCVLHTPPCEPGWSPLRSIVSRIWDPDADPQRMRADFLNQITHATNSWLSGPEWAGCADATKVVADRDVVTLGFDGSRGRSKGKPDATALVACRVTDGHLFEVGVWEATEVVSTWDTWEPPIVEIEAAIADCFRRFTVAGFYADPGKDWCSHINTWEARHGVGVTVRSSAAHPFEWWMTGGRSGLVQRAIEQMEGAVRNRDLTHDGSYGLTRHILNARRRISHQKLALGKENDYSSKKIDAATAAVLAWQARLDAISAGVGTEKKRSSTKVGRLY